MFEESTRYDQMMLGQYTLRKCQQQAKREKIFQQESIENVIECNVSPILVENVDLAESGLNVAAPSTAKSPRVEKSALESLRVY